MKENQETSPNFSQAFQQMASFVAIAKAGSSGEVLDQLLQQCFVVLPKDPFSTAHDLSEAVHVLFGLIVPEKDIAQAITRLLKKSRLVEIAGAQFDLAPEIRRELESRLEAAKELEQKVKQSWLADATSSFPQLWPETLWSCLQKYLAQAFRRHGIQTVSLLLPADETTNELGVGLSGIVDAIICENFSNEDHPAAREAITLFFSTVRSDRHRAAYIAQLADAAFNYFCLAAPPEVSERLRAKLNQLTLLLDTNFLFGILNLHANPQVDVSAELLASIKKFKLPFKLRYYEATTREMTNTLYYFGRELRKQQWSQLISRAAVKSRAFSGIELRYHIRNAEQKLEVDDFLAPYKHWELVLKDRGIDVYRVTPSEQRLIDRATLEADYKDFLGRYNREKPHEAIQHDMAVMETVRSLRSNARSTLDAGAILVTCDTSLFRFDREVSRSEGRPSCTVLPSLLWQILRPFVSESEEFDKAFAETFALPEFTLSQGRAQKAASRMLSILAGYRDIPEETATKMLANDLLIKDLQTKTTNEEFNEAVESVVASENAILQEEKAALHRQLLAKERDRNLQQEKATQRLAEAKRDLDAKEAQIRALEEKALETDKLLKDQMNRGLTEKSQAETRLNEQADLMAAAEEKSLRTAKIASGLVSVLLVALFLITIHYVVRWEWLLNHSNSYALQAGVILLILFGINGLWVKPWRKTCWIAGFLGILFVLVQLLGGPVSDRKP